MLMEKFITSRFSGPLGLKWEFWGVKWGKEWFSVEAQQTCSYFWEFYVCANFCAYNCNTKEARISVKISTGNLLNVSWKSPGNLLGWICRHPD